MHAPAAWKRGGGPPAVRRGAAVLATLDSTVSRNICGSDSLLIFELKLFEVQVCAHLSALVVTNYFLSQDIRQIS